jgi:hypothetical protein
MSNFDDECKETISRVQKLLKQYPEWKLRYEGYANKINANSKVIKAKKLSFNEWKPLYLYLNVSAAKSHMTFSLRYLGQDVSKLKSSSGNVTISTDGFTAKNQRDFNCDVQLDNNKWRSDEAKKFRNHFLNNPSRTKKSGKGNEEHRIESLLLTEFSKQDSLEKLLCRIKPVKIAGIARFQMPTPIMASNLKSMKYSGDHGGGIDILSRIGTGGGTYLCIMEVKDENVAKEPPEKAILQGLAYATFIRELLRSPSGDEWWKLFGFGGRIPSQFRLYVACAMPTSRKIVTSFDIEELEIDNDSIHLGALYFNETNNKLIDIMGYLKPCRPCL